MDTEAAAVDRPEPTIPELVTLPLATLRAKVLDDAEPTRDAVERVTRTRDRSKAIKAYALKRAAGVCEACEQNAPFITAEGTPFLEVHHIGKLTDGGPGHPEHVAAVCPNCHRRAHDAMDADQFNRQLQGRVTQREALLARAG